MIKSDNIDIIDFLENYYFIHDASVSILITSLKKVCNEWKRKEVRFLFSVYFSHSNNFVQGGIFILIIYIYIYVYV